jgi:hypothetical protein
MIYDQPWQHGSYHPKVILKTKKEATYKVNLDQLLF